MRRLHGVGARHFFIALLPTKIPGFGITGRRLNPALSQIPETFRLPGATIQLSHWGEFFDEVYDNPKAFGIVNLTDACAGRALFGEDPTPRGDPKTYYFYYAGHPSAAVHRVVGERLVREARAAEPVAAK
jgi:phospholipase/lecithinase/hemolysin